ncbi:hypothetical protein [Lacicoccus alkaliphilus]|uniref:Uncharacterized protein n=1 Tax=Lacicoccus alkaliphilus DSM 16010 TaxID=1123231 RepID=A0A1M7G255_9BACL|nr:hypothetical protein [Salinicoccus alkaliphilus]SHM10434.1 hypothetical protein SAMN02745189_01556 [Salinicoccus alkaliphilus DSM 16010]
MKILVAGGTYKNQMTRETGRKQFSMVGGHVVARLLGRYSKHDIYLHTNMSSEAQDLTRNLRQSIRKDHVSTEYIEKVSAPFGILTDGGIHALANTFESARIHRRDGRFFRTFDAFVLTTDLNQRDFKYLRSYAHNNDIPLIIITCGEYRLHMTHPDDRLITLEAGAGLPLYHLHLSEIHESLLTVKIKDTPLITRQVQDKEPVSEGTFRKPATLLGQLIIFATGIALLIFLIMSVFEWFSAPGQNPQADIDWNAAVDHPDCSTVEACTVLGDRYLSALEEYMDISREPYVFFENRPRRTYQDYAVDDGAPELIEEVREVPGGAEPYLGYYDEFETLFPEEYTDQIDIFRLFSDGEGNTLAYVEISEDETVLAMDFRDNAHKAARYRTHVHEFAHLYSLPPEDFTDECAADTAMDCLKEDTLMHDYTVRFWSHYGAGWLENRYKSQAERDAFFANNITDFYVPYQAVNPKEDYAVTFTMFVTRAIPAESGQLQDIKVRSMYEDPEHVKLRADILRNLLELERAGD